MSRIGTRRSRSQRGASLRPMEQCVGRPFAEINARRQHVCSETKPHHEHQQADHGDDKRLMTCIEI